MCWRYHMYLCWDCQTRLDDTKTWGFYPVDCPSRCRRSLREEDYLGPHSIDYSCPTKYELSMGRKCRNCRRTQSQPVLTAGPRLPSQKNLSHVADPVHAAQLAVVPSLRPAPAPRPAPVTVPAPPPVTRPLVHPSSNPFSVQDPYIASQLSAFQNPGLTAPPARQWRKRSAGTRQVQDRSTGLQYGAPPPGTGSFNVNPQNPSQTTPRTTQAGGNLGLFLPGYVPTPLNVPPAPVYPTYSQAILGPTAPALSAPPYNYAGPSNTSGDTGTVRPRPGTSSSASSGRGSNAAGTSSKTGDGTSNKHQSKRPRK